MDLTLGVTLIHDFDPDAVPVEQRLAAALSVAASRPSASPGLVDSVDLVWPLGSTAPAGGPRLG